MPTGVSTDAQLAAIGLAIPGLPTTGSSSLATLVRQAITGGWSQQQLIQAIYNSKVFAARFPGIRGPDGHLLMSPAQYLQQEDQIRGVMKGFGLGWWHYNQPDDFAKFIQNGITADQVQTRLQLSQQLLRNNPQIVTELQRMFPMAGDMVKYGALGWLLDPSKGTQHFEQYITAAQMELSARQSGFNVSPETQSGQFGDVNARRQFFLGLAGRGISASQAEQAFAQGGPQLAQMKTLAARYHEGEISDKEFASALFSPNPQLEAKRQMLVSEEQAQWKAGSAWVQGQGGGLAAMRTTEALDR